MIGVMRDEGNILEEQSEGVKPPETEALHHELGHLEEIDKSHSPITVLVLFFVFRMKGSGL